MDMHMSDRMGAEPVAIGSTAHKFLFCHMLLDTHDPYKPAIIDWPSLDDDARNRLVSLPIWDIAVQTEGKASRNVRAYAGEIDDPLLKQAVELNGFEEARHKLVLSNLVMAYGIEPDYGAARHPEWSFMVTGFSECIDSFFAFGLFEMAKRSGFFPPELVDTFEPVMQEEGRHIIFFVNWLAWHRRTMAWWRRPWFELKVLAVWAYLLLERAGLARDLGGTDQSVNFTVTGSQAVGVDIGARELMSVCLSENDRRLSRYDGRLLRPTTVPRLVRLALRLMRKNQAAAAEGGR
jgi:hypothetical protein